MDILFCVQAQSDVTMAPTSSAATFSSAASTSSYVVQQQEERRSTTIVTTNAASEHSQGTGAQPLSAEGQPSKEASKSDSGTTTTLSTIAIERGQTRLVIALLKSGRRLDLKVTRHVRMLSRKTLHAAFVRF